MALKNILVYVDNTEAFVTRMGVATALATVHGACVTGLYVRPILEVPRIADSVGGRELVESLRQGAERQAHGLHEKFRSLVDPKVPAEWVDVSGNVVESLVKQARYTDLVIVGQSPVLDGLSRTPGHN